MMTDQEYKPQLAFLLTNVIVMSEWVRQDIRNHKSVIPGDIAHLISLVRRAEELYNKAHALD